MTNTNQPEQNALGGGCRYYVSMRVAHLFEQALFQWHPPDWCMPFEIATIGIYTIATIAHTDRITIPC